jgi:hypothetical protein
MHGSACINQRSTKCLEKSAMIPLPEPLVRHLPENSTPASLRAQLEYEMLFNADLNRKALAWKWVYDNEEASHLAQFEQMKASADATRQSADATLEAAKAARDSAYWTKWAAIAAAAGAIIQVALGLIR